MKRFLVLWIIVTIFCAWYVESEAAEYEVKVYPSQVYDGDTITDVVVELGFDVMTKVDFRLHGIDTPEIRTRNKVEKVRGYKARDFLREWITKSKSVKIVPIKKGKFGRWVAKLFIDGKNASEVMIKMGLGKKYDGGKR